MSMLAGATLLASTLLGTGPARAAEVPAEFGTDWHDPVTAAPPVGRPAGKFCEVTVAQAQFRDFTPYRGTYTPPDGCGERWSKVVLRLDGKVKGRQYDRLGYLHVGGVEIFRTSTPQPSPDGIEWSVEKDVTRYSDTFRGRQDVEMLIGNVVDDTYTGVLDVEVTLTFYPGRPDGESPDQVLTLDHGADGATTLTTPRNSERIVAEVYATGSGGGCEEYWYLAVPDPAPYSCKAGQGPYREVQISVDGRLAGIAAPFPTVWTGGWSNPFLWYVIPGPRAFDIKPISYDLTPFAGLLNDGRPHRVEVSVVGVPEGQAGWSTPVNVLVWQDEQRAHVTGKLTAHKEGDLTNSSHYTPGSEHRVDTEGAPPADRRRIRRDLARPRHDDRQPLARQHLGAPLDRRRDERRAGGHLDRRRVGDRRRARTGAHHTHGPELHDGRHDHPRAGDRLRTVLTLGDRATTAASHGGRRTAWSRLDDSYTGDATYTANVPRDQRHAVGTTSERYRLYGSHGCYDRTLTTVQGVLTRDRRTLLRRPL